MLRLTLQHYSVYLKTKLNCMGKASDFLPKTAEEYLETRVKDQIDWYDKKSAKNKTKFLTLKVTEIILALFIPFLSGYINDDTNDLKVIVGALGIVVAAIAGLV